MTCERSTPRILFALICCCLVCIPFLLVTFPPVTDLPQHVAQVRLFNDALSNPDSPYRIQWITPYSLVYSLLGLSYGLVGPEHAGSLGLLLLAFLWIAMVHLLAAKGQRPSYGAVLATVLFFSHIMYWGFYQFILGWIVFLGWVLLTQTKRKKMAVEFLLFFLGAALLYMAHVLWLCVALGWLIVGDVLFRRQWKTLFFRVCGTIPVCVLVIIWYPSLAAYGFTSGTHWFNTPLQRFSFSWLVESSLGGLKGSLEYVVVGVILALVIITLVQYRRDILKQVNSELVFLGIGFFILGFLLPDKHTNTIQFAQRWIPPALCLVLLSLPPLRVKRWMPQLGMVVVLFGFILSTSLSWMMFESAGFSGLEKSLGELPENSRVIGLSYIQRSPIVRGKPFIQVFAYGQVYKGGELNFSFADFGPSLVVYRKKRRMLWTSGLEWFPDRARVKDFTHFDFALINGSDELHAQLTNTDLLNPVTKQGRWRLYKTSTD
ncbi:hypothetical protein ACFLT2_04585 [Acidobacteriota bacterium]